MRGVPLRFAVYARGNSTPVLELKATDISYGAVAASDFAISPPPGAKVVSDRDPGGGRGRGRGARRRSRPPQRSTCQVTGVAAVAAQVPFTLVAPGRLVGLPRHDVSLLDTGGSRGALVTYGQNLGGIA